MNGQDHFTLPTELLGQIAEPSLDFLPELIPLLLNTARPTEGKLHLAVAPELVDQLIDQLRSMDINSKRSRLA